MMLVLLLITWRAAAFSSKSIRNSIEHQVDLDRMAKLETVLDQT